MEREGAFGLPFFIHIIGKVIYHYTTTERQAMKILIVLSLLLFPKIADAGSLFFQPFSGTDYALYGLAVTANTTDMLTTLDIKNVPSLHETNVIMGPHPSDAVVIGYFLAVDALEGAIGYMVPPVMRKTLFMVDIGVESYFTVNNFHLGLRFAF